MSRRGTRGARRAQATGFGWQKREAAEWALLHLQLVTLTKHIRRVVAVMPEFVEAIGRVCDWVIVTAAAARDEFALNGPQLTAAVVDEVSDPGVRDALDEAVGR